MKSNNEKKALIAGINPIVSTGNIGNLFSFLL